MSNSAPRNCESYSGWPRSPRASSKTAATRAAVGIARSRRLCADHGLIYQGFSLLTANRAELGRPAVRALAERTSGTPAELVFRFARELGMLPLTGTSDERHMRLDLAAVDAPLEPADVQWLERAFG